jgi:predicted RNA-binding Zn ribbon-like protein
VVDQSETRTWVLPDEPVPIRLMSTIWADTDGIHDDLTTPRDLDAWLDAVRVDRAGKTATTQDLAAARRLRDAIRRLAAHVTDDDRPAAASAMAELTDAIEHINAAAMQTAAPAVTLHNGHLSLGVQAGIAPITAAIAHVAEQSIQLLAGDQASTLRACHAPGCVLYFVKSHARREWCSVTCGNRARAARHYKRTRTTR